MNLTSKEKKIIVKFNELQKRYGDVFISARFGNRPRFMRLDDKKEMKVTIGGEFGGFINQRVLNGLDSKGLIQPVDINFNCLTNKEVQDSLYNKEIGFIGAIITE